MKSIGQGLMIGAVLLMCGALLYSPTVSAGEYGASVYNLGALQYQELVFQAGVGALVAGSVLYSAGELLERMERAGTAKSAPPPSPETTETRYDCSWCGRDMFPHKPCSSGTDEVNRARAPRIVDPKCLDHFEKRGLRSKDREESAGV